MNALLDTQLVLWWLANDRRLGRAARAAIEDPATRVYVSTASLWEMAIKSSLGKLRADLDDVIRACAVSSFAMLAIEPRHTVAYRKLPVPVDHRDPFDRMLVAQARAEGLTLLTTDRAVAAYGAGVRSVL